MSYTAESGRMQILDDAAAAVGELEVALGQLGEAYDHLDEHTAEAMEDKIFRPLQGAYGLLRRVAGDFAGRYGLTARDSEPPPLPAPQDPRVAFEQTADSIDNADRILSDLQDSLLPVEVGDRELRTGLSEVRTQLTPLPGACDAMIRGFGR